MDRLEARTPVHPPAPDCQQFPFSHSWCARLFPNPPCGLDWMFMADVTANHTAEFARLSGWGRSRASPRAGPAAAPPRITKRRCRCYHSTLSLNIRHHFSSRGPGHTGKLACMEPRSLVGRKPQPSGARRQLRRGCLSQAQVACPQQRCNLQLHRARDHPQAKPQHR